MAGHKLNKGINDGSEINISVKNVLLSYLIVSGLKPSAILPYIPQKSKMRVRFTFLVLMFITTNPGTTKTGAVNKMNSTTQSMSYAIDYLFELGFIREVKRPRLIIPFQAYKIDIGYMVTTRGETVIKKIIEKAIDS